MEAKALGTFACPICGVAVPHGHPDAVVAAYRSDQIRNDGWTSAIKAQPKESGWYLCLVVEIDPKQRGEPRKMFEHAPQWSQLSWFLWVRLGAARGPSPVAGIPEVLFWDSLYRRWSLRNLLGNAVASGDEARWTVEAQPRLWREVPAVKTSEGAK
jgi:hypothetical protein